MSKFKSLMLFVDIWYFMMGRAEMVKLNEIQSNIFDLKISKISSEWDH